MTQVRSRASRQLFLGEIPRKGGGAGKSKRGKEEKPITEDLMNLMTTVGM